MINRTDLDQYVRDTLPWDELSENWRIVKRHQREPGATYL